MSVHALPALRRLFALFFVLAGLSCAASAAHASSSPSIEDRAAELFWWGDFKALEALYADVRASRKRDAQGKRDIDHFRAGLGRVFRGRQSDSVAYYTELVRWTQWHADRNPGSSLAHLMVARALYGHAWAVRGGSFSSEVPAQAMATFDKGIRAAEKYVADHAAVVMADTTAHIYLLMIGRSAGWSHAKHWAVLQDALRRDPEERGVHVELMITMQPKWGGDADEMEAVVQDAVQRTREVMGLAMYADVYMTAVYDLQGGFFRETRARWDKMRQGFDDLLARYPSAINVNRYAMVACLAEDKPVAAKLLDELADAPIVKQWGGEPGQRLYESCKQWAREK